MDRRHRFIVSLKHQFIYYEIQKCATGSMRKYFINEGYCAERISGDRSLALPYVEKGYYQFTFVRNPWERVVSTWLSKFLIYHDPLNPDLPGIRDSRLSKKTTFDGFVRFISGISDKQADCHFKSQHTFIPVDDIYIGRVENLQEDFDNIRIDLGLPLLPIPHEHKVYCLADTPYRNFYNDETRELVAERYKRDIALYGYEFE